jgi:hypothetical protein
MQLRNRTPFAPFTFQSLDLADEPFQVVIVKGTFDIHKDAPLERSAEQEPVRTGDEYWDDPRASSLRWEDDLAPFKPRADIVVNATAYAPGGLPAKEWLAGVTVGGVTKQVLVTGPRAWVYAPPRGWVLGSPSPTAYVPIRYEHAFGGRIERDGQVYVHEQNPAGLGFVDVRQVDTSRAVPAPTILTRDGRLPVLGETYPVEGLSAVAKPWLPRRTRAGTFDAAWVAERHPRLPLDFDCGFFNCAHSDLIYDGYFRGDEEVRLERLHREHAIVTFRLPSLVVAAAITDRDGYRYGSPARLDTLTIDAERMKVLLLWRAALPLYRHGIARLDIAMRESLAVTRARANRGSRALEGV